MATNPTATAASWEPVRDDAAGNVWLWSYRDGKGTRIIVGPVERVYVEGLHQQLSAALEERHQADVRVERHRQLVAAARRVVNTPYTGASVAVDSAAYNDLRDVLRGLGVLD